VCVSVLNKIQKDVRIEINVWDLRFSRR
jgi:hypothetical protein